jgi:hypothetical protein
MTLRALGETSQSIAETAAAEELLPSVIARDREPAQVPALEDPSESHATRTSGHAGGETARRPPRDWASLAECRRQSGNGLRRGQARLHEAVGDRGVSRVPADLVLREPRHADAVEHPHAVRVWRACPCPERTPSILGVQHQGVVDVGEGVGAIGRTR